MTGIAVAHGGATTPDGVLVQEAAAGSGVSYGALYDRYATQVYNYSLRLTGSPEDAADATQEAFVNVLRRLQQDDRPVLEFSSYLFAAARNESYSLMRQRARQHPSESPPEEPGRVADVDTDPERAALLRDTQEAVQEANAKLAPRHREALALREVAGRSYDEVAQIMGITPNAAAQLIWRARSKLRGALTAGAVASVVATSEDCERAQLLLSKAQDGEAVEETDRLWLEEHLDECGSCQTANRMLLAAGASYRMWVPVALLAGMRGDTLAAAGGVLGADWSGAAASGQAATASSAGAGSSAGGTAAVAAVAGTVIVAAGIAFVTLTGGEKAKQVSATAERPAVEAPAAPAKSAPARPDRAKAAARSATLVAARAPSATPAAAKPAAPKLQTPTPPDSSPTPRQRPPGPNAGPTPPPDTGPPPAEPVAPQPRTAPPAPPAVQIPPVVPATPPPSECNWAGGGKGPSGCPPGRGGLPPGQGGSPPGLGDATPPGRGGSGPPGHTR